MLALEAEPCISKQLERNSLLRKNSVHIQDFATQLWMMESSNIWPLWILASDQHAIWPKKFNENLNFAGSLRAL